MLLCPHALFVVQGGKRHTSFIGAQDASDRNAGYIAGGGLNQISEVTLGSLIRLRGPWGGRFGWWLLDFLVKVLLTQWLLAQGVSVSDWAKFNFLRQPDHKVILSPHEESPRRPFAFAGSTTT